MAKAIDNATAALISDIQSGDTPANQILATEAVGLSVRGFIELDDNGDLALTRKAFNALRRFERDNEIAVATEAVRGVVDDILTEPGGTTQHRAIWNAVGGPDRFDRDTVSKALDVLKDEGILAAYKRGTNNFQHYWCRAGDVPTTPEFETNSGD